MLDSEKTERHLSKCRGVPKVCVQQTVWYIAWHGSIRNTAWATWWISRIWCRRSFDRRRTKHSSVPAFSCISTAPCTKTQLDEQAKCAHLNILPLLWWRQNFRIMDIAVNRNYAALHLKAAFAPHHHTLSFRVRGLRDHSERYSDRYLLNSIFDLGKDFKFILLLRYPSPLRLRTRFLSRGRGSACCCEPELDPSMPVVDVGAFSLPSEA